MFAQRITDNLVRHGRKKHPSEASSLIKKKREASRGPCDRVHQSMWNLAGKKKIYKSKAADILPIHGGVHCPHSTSNLSSVEHSLSHRLPELRDDVIASPATWKSMLHPLRQEI